MEKVKAFFSDIADIAKNIVGYAKDLFKNDKKRFVEIVLKGGLGILFLISLMLPFYYGVVIGLKIRVGLFNLKAWWIYFLIFLSFALLYLLFGFGKKPERAKKIFKVHTILVIIMVFWTLLLYWADTSEVAVSGLSFGFFLNLIIAVLMAILTWKESLLLGPINKIIFKGNVPVKEETAVVNEDVEVLEEVEVVEKKPVEEPTDEPKEQPVESEPKVIQEEPKEEPVEVEAVPKGETKKE